VEKMTTQYFLEGQCAFANNRVGSLINPHFFARSARQYVSAYLCFDSLSCVYQVQRVESWFLLRCISSANNVQVLSFSLFVTNCDFPVPVEFPRILLSARFIFS